MSFENEKKLILVTEAMGPDIRTFYRLLNHEFSLKTISLIGLQMVIYQIKMNENDGFNEGQTIERLT